jgi:hypothetical protein
VSACRLFDRLRADRSFCAILWLIMFFQVKIEMLKKLLMYGLETGEDISSIEKNIRRCRRIYWVSSILSGFMFLIWLASAIILYPLYTFPIRWLIIYLLVVMLIVVGIFVSCIVAVFFWLRADILELRKLFLEKVAQASCLRTD